MTDDAPEGRRAYGGGVAYGVLTFGAVALVGLLSSVATARAYGVGVIGEYAIALIPAGSMVYLSSLREQAGLVRALSVLPARDPLVTGLFAAVFGFSLLFTGVVGTIAVPLTLILFHDALHRPELVAPALTLLAVYVALENSCWNLDMVFASFNAGREMFVARLVQAIAFLVVALAGAIVFDSVWGLVLATAASWLAGLLQRLVLIRALMRFRVSRAALREGMRTLPDLIRFGMRLAPGSLMEGLKDQVGTWVLGGTVAVTSVGGYNRAWTLARRFSELNNKVTEQLLPALVHAKAEGLDARFDAIAVDTIRYGTFGVCALAAAGAGTADGLMDIYGPGFDVAALALALLLAEQAIDIVPKINDQVLVALGRPTLVSVIAAGRAVITTVLTFAFTPSMGVTGPAVALLSGALFDIAISSIVVLANLATDLTRLWPLRGMIGLVSATAGGVVTSRAADLALPGVLGPLIALPAALLVFMALFAGIAGVLPRDRARMAAARARLTARSEAAA